jgi:hypothetical protein
VAGRGLLKPVDIKAAKSMTKKEVKEEEVHKEVTTPQKRKKPNKPARKRKKPSSSTGSDSGLATSSPRRTSSPEYDASDMAAYEDETKKLPSFPPVVVSSCLLLSMLVF